MSRIVKAKWVVHRATDIDDHAKEEAGKNQVSDEYDKTIGFEADEPENQLDQQDQLDHQLEAIRLANDLMKSTLRASREVAEKCQEDGFDQGYKEGYQVGYETGFQEGVDKGKKEAADRLEASLVEIRLLATTIAEEREQAVFQREDEIITFAMEIAKKIMRYEIKKDQDNFVQIFHEVIHKDDEGVKIYLSEYQKTLDLYLPKTMIEKIKKLSKKMKIVLLKEDDKIVVETDDAVIDMAVPVQLGEIKKAIENNK